jgi:hypothetical protein
MVSLITALIIQENGAEVATYSSDNKKYGFEIYSMIRDSYRPHLTSQPTFKSERIAKKNGEDTLKAIQALDLNGKRKEISDILGDAGPAVAKIIKGSKK